MNKIKNYPKLILFIFFIFYGLGCNESINKVISEQTEIDFIKGVDISRYPEIREYNQVFYDTAGVEKDFLEILKENGINTVRLRLWLDPVEEHSTFSEVYELSKELKGKNFKVWLTLHYSDTWADPAHQIIPKRWSKLNLTELKDSVYSYSKRVVNAIEPDYIQIGNEINSGFLHPLGDINSNYNGFIELLNSGISAVRDVNSDTEIIIHFAGINGSDWFFEKVKDLDFDIIGLSYYPIWHGKSFALLKERLDFLGSAYNKKIVIAETSYPFTLSWNDWTNNIVGTDEQLILPDYPASFEGQKNYLNDLLNITKSISNGLGICYWGAELIAWKGETAKDGSPWENQALFDFNNKAVPALTIFKKSND